MGSTWEVEVIASQRGQSTQSWGTEEETSLTLRARQGRESPSQVQWEVTEKFESDGWHSQDTVLKDPLGYVVEDTLERGHLDGGHQVRR